MKNYFLFIYSLIITTHCTIAQDRSIIKTLSQQVSENSIDFNTAIPLVKKVAKKIDHEFSLTVYTASVDTNAFFINGISWLDIRQSVRNNLITAQPDLISVQYDTLYEHFADTAKKIFEPTYMATLERTARVIGGFVLFHDKFQNIDIMVTKEFVMLVARMVIEDWLSGINNPTYYFQKNGLIRKSKFI